MTLNASASAPMAEISARLAKPRVLCGHFEQVKQLRGIKKAFASSGCFCVTRDKGILWETRFPFANTLKVTPDKIIQAHGVQVTSELDAQQEPVVGMINRVLFSLLAGDFSQLDTLFLMQGGINNQHWHMTLKARDARLASAIGLIQLAGDRLVKKVVLTEATGDRTSITFLNLTTSGDGTSC